MIPSTQDINETGREYLAALVVRDVAYLAAASSDLDNGYCFIGSRSEERWSLPELLDCLPYLPVVRLTESNPSGFVVGDTAWLVDFPGGVLANGESIALRATLILQLFEDLWKVVHCHVSEGVAHNFSQNIASRGFSSR